MTLMFTITTLMFTNMTDVHDYVFDVHDNDFDVHDDVNIPYEISVGKQTISFRCPIFSLVCWYQVRQLLLAFQTEFSSLSLLILAMSGTDLLFFSIFFHLI